MDWPARAFRPAQGRALAGLCGPFVGRFAIQSGWGLRPGPFAVAATTAAYATGAAEYRWTPTRAAPQRGRRPLGGRRAAPQGETLYNARSVVRIWLRHRLLRQRGRALRADGHEQLACAGACCRWLLHPSIAARAVDGVPNTSDLPDVVTAFMGSTAQPAPSATRSRMAATPSISRLICGRLPRAASPIRPYRGWSWARE